jgi:serine O-acetyltransferase
VSQAPDNTRLPLASENPRAARLLLWLARRRAKRIFRLLSIFLGSDMPCRDYGDLKLPHPYGVMIAEDARIGLGCVFYHNVTLGRRDGSPGAPDVQDEVFIGSNAIVLGGVCIGRGAIIGAGAVVVTDVPAGATVVGNPARVVRPA